MKKYFVLLLLAFCTSSSYSQELLSNDIKYLGGETKDNINFWKKTNLYYYIHNCAKDLTPTQCQTAIQNAFNIWSQYSNFTFTRTYTLSQADIEIKWLTSPIFEVTDTIPAFSWIGYMDNRTPPGFIFFNDYLTFTMTSSGYNLQSVALKEIGHVLGIPGLSNPSAVMGSGYSYCTDLTGYDLSVLYYLYPYSFPGTLTGPKLIYSDGTYEINNFPSCLTTSWHLSNSYYNNSSYLVSNFPVPGYCIIFRNNSHDMMNGTLTATVLKDSIAVKTLTMSGIYAYDDFWGQYTSGNQSGNINYTHTFGVKANATTYITSPNFYGATVTYDSSSGAIPSVWAFSPTYGDLTMVAPSGNVPVVINVHDGCGNDYTLYAFVSSYSINVSNEEDGITVTLVEDGDASKDFTPEEPWTFEIINAATGRVMAMQSSTSRSETISTAGWPKGIYVVKVTIGEEVLTEKVLVK